MTLKGGDDGLRPNPKIPVSGDVIADGGERFLQRRDGFIFTAQSQRRHVLYGHIIEPQTGNRLDAARPSQTPHPGLFCGQAQYRYGREYFAAQWRAAPSPLARV